MTTSANLDVTRVNCWFHRGGGIMDIAVVSNLHQHIIEFKDDMNARGFEGFVGLYSNHKAWLCPVDLISEIDADIYIFSPGADTGVISRMLTGVDMLKARNAKVIILARDSDPPTHWLINFPLITELTVDLFDASDAVVTHHENMVDVIQPLTSTPVECLGEPNCLATYKLKYPSDKSERNTVLLPTTHCGSYNSKRNAMINYSVIKQLLDDGFINDFVIVANSVFAHTDLDSANEYEFLNRLGLAGAFRLIQPRSKKQVIEMLLETKLFINLDATNAIGHWHIDAAALRAPTVSTNMPYASRLFKQTFSEYDVEGIVGYAKELLENPTVDAEHAFEGVDHFSYGNVRARLEEIIEKVSS